MNEVNYDRLDNKELLEQLELLVLSNNKLSFVLTTMMENKKIFNIYIREVLPTLPKEVLNG